MNNFVNSFKNNKTKNKNNIHAGINIFLFLIVFIIIIFLIYSIFLYSKYKKISSYIKSGQENIETSLDFFRKTEFSEAVYFSKEANRDFNLVLSEMEALSNNFVIKKIPLFSTNLEDFLYLAKTIEILSRSAEKTFFIASQVEDIFSGKEFSDFTDFDEYERYKILKIMHENSPDINGIKANIDLSLFYFEKSKNNKFLKSYNDQFKKVEEYLNYSSNVLNSLSFLSSLLPAISGYPDEKTYLFVLQNNNELRPSGGFIGSYALLSLHNGNVVNLEINDIYHLDMPASLNKDFNISPPDPIKKYLGVDRWFLRDANWSPDFPSSAKNIKYFYEQEMIASGRDAELKDISAVIAITPRIITDLLYITGPIEIDGNIYNKDNFVDVLQHEVEMAFREKDISEWDRKNVIGGIVLEIEKKLTELASDNWAQILSLFRENISRKNFLVYFFDENKRNLTKDFNWMGEIKSNESDYLMAVDANLAAFKTDRVMDKKISYYLNQEENSIDSKLDIYYKNNGWFDWQTTRYRTYTRVYAPLGSKLIKGSGLSSGEVLSEDYNNIFNPKTYMAGFISIEPGQERVLSFEYQLAPQVLEKIKNNNYYSLLVQKQPGNNISQFSATLKFKNKIREVRTDSSFELINDKELHWTNDLEKDYLLEVFFE